MQNFKNISLCLALALTLSACTPVTAQRGNLLEDYQFESLQPGTSTQSDVLRALGSPTTQSTFDLNKWYYMGQKKEKKGILDSEIVDERIVIVTFNQEGVLQTIEDSTESREDIPYAREKTATHGNDLTFMQQLLGNMGRFNAPTTPK